MYYDSDIKIVDREIIGFIFIASPFFFLIKQNRHIYSSFDVFN